MDEVAPLTYNQPRIGEAMTWTQPVCEDCWYSLYPEREPTRLRQAEIETCCKCGIQTWSGIYIRIDPKTVPYPRNE